MTTETNGVNMSKPTTDAQPNPAADANKPAEPAPNAAPADAKAVTVVDPLRSRAFDFDELAALVQSATAGTQGEPDRVADPFTADMTLRVDFAEFGEVYHIRPKRTDIAIGRKDPSSGDAPEIDLTAFGAYQMGVSRQHAMIFWTDEKLSLRDLGSRNGTYLNGVRLAAHQSYPLRNNDEIKIGKIALKLTFTKH
jgi:hypothetical protein